MENELKVFWLDLQKNIRLDETLERFIQKNTANGWAGADKGWDAYWLVNQGCVPYIVQNGKMRWRIPLDQVKLADLVRTFQIETGSRNGGKMEFWEQEYYLDSFENNIELERRLFKNFWKETAKSWLKGSYIFYGKCLTKFIRNAGVRPKDVLYAIWIQQSYKPERFSEIFSCSIKQAHRILQAVGYEKKDCNSEYEKVDYRIDDLKTILEKVAEADGFGDEAGAKKRFARTASNVLHGIGSRMAAWGDHIGYKISPLERKEEPALGERRQKAERILIFTISFILLLFVFGTEGAFIWQFSHTPQKYSDALYNFWGAVVGASIAGLATICTTFFIIRRSYKIDYHTERMAVMPVFDLCVVRFGFHDLDEGADGLPPDVAAFLEEEEYFQREVYGELCLLRYTNVGRGPAFFTELSGPWPEYENISMQTIQAGCYKYLIAAADLKKPYKVSYKDLYGNLYYQLFQPCGPYSDRSKSWHMNGEPPELVMRTRRYRYVQ